MAAPSEAADVDALVLLQKPDLPLKPRPPDLRKVNDPAKRKAKEARCNRVARRAEFISLGARA